MLDGITPDILLKERYLPPSYDNHVMEIPRNKIDLKKSKNIVNQYCPSSSPSLSLTHTRALMEGGGMKSGTKGKNEKQHSQYFKTG